MDRTVTFSIDLPPGAYSRVTPEWRMAEYVRVLNAHALLGSARGDYQPQSYYVLDKPGPKFTRINKVGLSQTFVHCFVENATGKVIKAAGYKAPAKDKGGLAYRWDLMDEADRALLYKQTDEHGGIFYAGVPERLRRERDEAAEAVYVPGPCIG